MTKRFEWFKAVKGNSNVKVKLIFQHFGRVLKGMPRRKRAKLMRNHHNWMSAAFRDKAQRFIWEVFGDDVYEEQYKYPGKRDEQVQQDTCQTGTDTQ